MDPLGGIPLPLRVVKEEEKEEEEKAEKEIRCCSFICSSTTLETFRLYPRFCPGSSVQSPLTCVRLAYGISVICQKPGVMDVFVFHVYR